MTAAERSRQHLLVEWNVGLQESTYTVESRDAMTLLEEREWVAWMRRNFGRWLSVEITLGEA